MNCRIWFALVCSMLGPLSASYAQPVEVSLPVDAAADPGASIAIPILVDNITGKTVLNYQAIISYDNRILRATGASSAGTLTESFNTPFVEIRADGRIFVGASGLNPPAGQGVFVFLLFEVLGQPGDTSALRFDWFQFNTGIPSTSLTDGKFTVNVPARPRISINPTQHNFGEQFVNEATAQVFMLLNSGDAILNVESVMLSGLNSSDFAVQGIATPTSILPGQELDFSVLFSPDSTGNREALLSILSNDPDASILQVPLAGTGIPLPVPDIELSSNELEFGSVPLDSFAIRPFIIKNVGEAELTVESTRLTGTFAADFVTKGKNAPFTIAAQGSQNFLISFRPSAAGEEQVTLTIISDDPDESIVSVEMRGTGFHRRQPELEITPASFDFGTLAVDSTRSTQFVLRNLGDAPLVLDSLLLNGTGSSHFRIDDLVFPLVVAPEESLILSIAFAPFLGGRHSASLTVFSNDPAQQEMKVDVIGTAVGALSLKTTILKPSGGAVICGDSVAVALTWEVENAVSPVVISCAVNGKTATRLDSTFALVLPVVPGKNTLVANCSVIDSLKRTASSLDSVTVVRHEIPTCFVEIVSPDSSAVVRDDSVLVVVQHHPGAEAAPPLQQTCKINGIAAVKIGNDFQAIVPCFPGEMLISATCTSIDSCGFVSVCSDTITIECREKESIVLLGIDEDREAMVYLTINAPQPQLLEAGKVIHNGKKVGNMEAMALNPFANCIYISSNEKGGRLFKVDVDKIPPLPSDDDIVVELVGKTGSTFIDGLAFREETAELLGVDTGTGQLVKIDENTAKVTDIGPLGFSDVEGLAFSKGEAPVLYGIDNDSHKLLTIDLKTGHGTAVGPKKVGFKNVESLAFSESGLLIGFSDHGRDTFIEIDPMTGIGKKFNKVNANGFDVEGLSFLEISVDLLNATSVSTLQAALPEAYRLLQNYPNPFNPQTKISFEIPATAVVSVPVSLKVFDITGRLVRTLLNERLFPGKHVYTWNGRDSRGYLLASGVYIYTLSAGQFTLARRMLLVK